MFLFLKKSYATAIQNVPVRILSGRKGNKDKFEHFIKEWRLAFLFIFFQIYLTFTKTFNMRDLPRKLPCQLREIGHSFTAVQKKKNKVTSAEILPGHGICEQRRLKLVGALVRVCVSLRVALLCLTAWLPPRSEAAEL